jgi:hypothetical protein
MVAAGMTATLMLLVPTGRTLWAQQPTVLMFYGSTLTKPVIVSGADAMTFRGLITPASISARDLGDRSYVPVALFWASRLDPARNGTRAYSDLTPEMAWQHGRFYPPAPGKPAVLLVTKLAKRAQPVPLPSDAAAFIWGGPVSPAALEMLERLGVLAGPGR